MTRFHAQKGRPRCSSGCRAASNVTPVQNHWSGLLVLTGARGGGIREPWQGRGWRSSAQPGNMEMTDKQSGHADGHALPAAMDEPFLMYITDIVTIPGQYFVAVGEICSGCIEPRHLLDIVGFDPTIQASCRYAMVKGVEKDRVCYVPPPFAPQWVEIVLSIGRDAISLGKALATPGTMPASTKFVANLSVRANSPLSITNTSRPQFLCNEANITTNISLPEGRNEVGPGESAFGATMTLVKPLALRPGLQFYLRDSGKTFAEGEVIEVDQSTS